MPYSPVQAAQDTRKLAARLHDLLLQSSHPNQIRTSPARRADGMSDGHREYMETSDGRATIGRATLRGMRDRGWLRPSRGSVPMGTVYTLTGKGRKALER